MLEADLSVELALGSEKSKGITAGAVTAKFISFSGGDFASVVKRAGADGNPDIAIRLDISAYGSILTDVFVRSLGESRQWDTTVSSIYPDVALLADNTVQNKADGSLEYPLQKMTETVDIYMSRGSANTDKITGFELILNLDGTKITVTVTLN